MSRRLQTIAASTAVAVAATLVGGLGSTAMAFDVDHVGPGPVPPNPLPRTSAIDSGGFGAGIRWRACGDARGQQCAIFTVPRLWSKPRGAQIELSLRRLPARGKNADQRPTVFINPGGPGASGTETVKALADDFEPLRKTFNVVGFDPRGVAPSGPRVRECDVLPLGQQLPIIGPINWNTAVQSTNSQIASQYATCVAKNRSIQKVIATRQVVRDLNAMRAAVGDRQLTYVGYSYGTTIGRAYLQKYPQRVRAMILDGVTTPTANWTKDIPSRITGSSKGWRMIRKELGPEFRSAYSYLNSYLQSAVIPTGDADLNRWLAWTAVINGSRNPSALSGTYSFVCETASAIGWTGSCPPRARTDQATVPQSNPMTQMVNCVDLRGRPGPQQLAPPAQRAFDAGNAPAAQNALNFNAMCPRGNKPVAPLKPLKKTRLATPPLIINGTGDTATPFPGAQRTRQLLTGSRLIRVPTTFHGLFLISSSRCVKKAGLQYLRKQQLPAKNLRCQL